MIIRQHNFFYSDSNWSSLTKTEEAAFTSYSEVASLFFSDFFCFLSMPWSSSSFKYSWTHKDLLKFADKIQSFDRVFTVFQGGDIDEYLELFRLLGVTDVFSPFVSNETKWRLKELSIRIYPLPLVPSNYVETGLNKPNKLALYSVLKGNSKTLSEQVQSQLDIERAKFVICKGSDEELVEQVWRCIMAEAIPVVPPLRIYWPGKKEFWKEGMIEWEPQKQTVDEVKLSLTDISIRTKEIAERQQAVRQLKLSYQPDMILTDLFELLHEVEGFYRSSSYQRLRHLLNSDEKGKPVANVLSYLGSLTPTDFCTALNTKLLKGFEHNLTNYNDIMFFDELKVLKGAVQ